MQHAKINVLAVTKDTLKLSIIEGYQDQEHFAGLDFTADAESLALNQETKQFKAAINRVMTGLSAAEEIEIQWLDRWHKVLHEDQHIVWISR